MFSLWDAVERSGLDYQEPTAFATVPPSQEGSELQWFPTMSEVPRPPIQSPSVRVVARDVCDLRYLY